MMRRFTRPLWKEWRRMRVLAIALALGGAVWTVALRVGTWGRAPASDFFPATAGLFVLVAAAILPAASIAGDRRLPRLAALRVRPLPRCPFLISKWLACLVLWLALTALASAVALVCMPSAESLEAWRRALDAGLVWGSLIFGCCFFASAAMRRPALALLLGGALGALPPLVLCSLFAVPLQMDDGLGANRAVVGYTSLFLFVLTWWALDVSPVVAERHRQPWAGLRQRAAVVVAALGMVLLGPLSACIVELSLGPEDAEAIYDLRLSPDGRAIAFTASFEQWPFEPGARCYVLNTETGEARPLTSLKMSSADFGRGWSPQARYFAYSTRPGLLGSAWARLSSRKPFWESGARLLDTRTGTDRELAPAALYGVYDALWAEEGELLMRADTWPVVERRLRDPSWFDEDPFEGLADELVLRYRVASRELVADRSPAILGRFDGAVEGRGGRYWEAGWELKDPEAQRFTLDYRNATAPGALGGTFTLLDSQRGTSQELGRIDRRLDQLGAYCTFSPGARWLAYPARDAEGAPAIWLHEPATGQRTRLKPPGPILEWVPRFALDETKLVWVHGQTVETWAGSFVGAPEFHVQDIPEGAPRPLPLPEELSTASERGYEVAVGADALFFTRGAELYRIGLDGTGLEMLFPERRSIRLGRPRAGNGAEHAGKQEERP